MNRRWDATTQRETDRRSRLHRHDLRAIRYPVCPVSDDRFPDLQAAEDLHVRLGPRASGHGARMRDARRIDDEHAIALAFRYSLSGNRNRFVVSNA